jgi:hypothetical protein
MADFEDKLKKILSSPEDMAKIADMARSISAASPAPEDAPPDDGDSSDAPGSAALALDPKMMRIMSSVMGAYSSGTSDKEALLGAIRPYLRSGRQEYVDRAAEIVRLTRLARAAIGAWQGLD